jgi:REP-associated tyrosine transposase
MPHVRRDTTAGIFHVYTHCVWASRHLYRDDLDRTVFLRRLAEVTKKTEWTCIGFCLMQSHYHLIVAVADGVLPVAMHSLNLGYARDFNRRHGLRGHVQFRRYGARRIDSDSGLLACFRYVMRNPVTAGLCDSPCDWPWSSYRGTVGLEPPHTFVDPDRVYDCFDGSLERRIAQLRAYVEES